MRSRNLAESLADCARCKAWVSFTFIRRSASSRASTSLRPGDWLSAARRQHDPDHGQSGSQCAREDDVDEVATSIIPAKGDSNPFHRSAGDDPIHWPSVTVRLTTRQHRISLISVQLLKPPPSSITLYHSRTWCHCPVWYYVTSQSMSTSKVYLYSSFS